MAADPQVHKAGLLQDPLLGLRQGDPLDAPAGIEQIHRLTACGDQQQGPVLLAPPKAGHGQPGNLAGPAHGHHEGIEAQLVGDVEQPRFQAVDGQPVEGITRLPHDVAPNRDLEMVDQGQQQAGVGPLATIGPKPTEAMLARFWGEPLAALKRLGPFDHQLAAGPLGHPGLAPARGAVPQDRLRRQGQPPPGLQTQQAREGGGLRQTLQIPGIHRIAVDQARQGLVGMDQQALLVEGVWSDNPPFGNRALQAWGWPRSLCRGPIPGGFGRSRQTGEEGIFLAADAIGQQPAEVSRQGLGQGSGSQIEHLAFPGGDTGFAQVAGQGRTCGQELEGPHQKGSLHALNRVLAKGLGGIEEAATALDHQHQSAGAWALADGFALGHGAGEGPCYGGLARGWLWARGLGEVNRLDQQPQGCAFRRAEFH